VSVRAVLKFFAGFLERAKAKQRPGKPTCLADDGSIGYDWQLGGQCKRWRSFRAR